ncbi:MAG: response regulator [Ferruginibacter sp.]
MKPIDILLVEDDVLDVVDINRSLDKLNILYRLKNARNGEEAIEVLTDRGAFGLQALPDLMLIDINMPKINGLELLEVIRKNEEWKFLKCFIITTSSEKMDRNAAYKLGVSGYLIKPLKLNSPSNMDMFNLTIDLMNFKSAE